MSNYQGEMQTVKILILGDKGVGKSSLIKSYVNQNQNPLD